MKQVYIYIFVRSDFLPYSISRNTGLQKVVWAVDSYIYHDRDVQDAELLLRRIIGWVFCGFREVKAAILVVDVEEQSAVLQPLLPPAH